MLAVKRGILLFFASCTAAGCATGHVVERANRAREAPDARAFADPDPRVQAAAVEGCARHPTTDCDRQVLEDLAQSSDPVVGEYVNKLITLRCDYVFAAEVLSQLNPTSLASLRRHISYCASPDILSALYFGQAGDEGKVAGVGLFRRFQEGREGAPELDERIAYLTWAMKFKGPSNNARSRLAEARDALGQQQRYREQLAKEEMARLARERLTVSGCVVGLLVSDLRPLITTKDLGECWAHLAREHLGQDRFEESRSAIFQAKAQGFDTAGIEAELTSKVAEAEDVAKRKREWEAKWGEFSVWRKRSANRAVVQFAVRLAQLKQSAARLQELHKAELEKNDEAVRDDDVIVSPIFPETSGSFAFVKILSQYDGEALFSASDGLFVLRLSRGDSFNAYPGQSVYMTIHSLGERMSMTSGARLPVFMSGSSPTRTRYIKGFKPNRTKEKSLLQRFEAENRAARTLIKSATVAVEGEDEAAVLKSARDSRLEWDRDGDRRLLIRDGDSPVYCIELGLSCPANGETVTSEQILDTR